MSLVNDNNIDAEIDAAIAEDNHKKVVWPNNIGIHFLNTMNFEIPPPFLLGNQINNYLDFFRNNSAK